MHEQVRAHLEQNMLILIFTVGFSIDVAFFPVGWQETKQRLTLCLIV